MTKRARVKRIDGDQSELPYVVQTPNDELVRISVRQANALANPSAPGYAATLEDIKRAEEAGSTNEVFYFKSVPFPKSPELADSFYRLVGRHLSSKLAAAMGTVIGLIGLVVFLFDNDLHSLRSASPSYAAVLVGTMLVWNIFLLFFYELGHAMVLIRFGQSIKAMGMCFYFGAPSFYTDSTLALLLTKRQRIIQSGAGVWVDFVAAGIVLIVFALTRPDGTVGAVRKRRHSQLSGGLDKSRAHHEARRILDAF